MKKSHDKRLLTCLKNNIIKFMTSGWKNREGELVHTTEDQTSLSDDQFPESGLYYTYNKFLKQEPLEPVKYKLFPRDKEARNIRYQLVYKNKKNRTNRVACISDGEDLYVNSNWFGNTESAGYSGSYFIKAKHYGKYIYFVDKLPKGFVTLTSSADFGLVRIGIDIGSAITSFDRPMILDTSTGEFIILNEELLLDLLADYPDLIYDYKVSDKWTKNIEEIIVKLNQKLE